VVSGKEDRVNWVIDFFTNPDNWSGPDGIPTRLLEHLEFSGISLLLAMLIALPLGLWIGHTGKGALFAILSANAARALPTLGLLVLIVLLMGVGTIVPVLIPLVALAVPPILVNTYEGIRNVDPDLRDAAYGMGLRGGQVLGRVLVPTALPLIMLGLRVAAIQVVSTATVAAYVGLGGLGRFIVDGLALQEYDQLMAGALLVSLLAIVTEVSFAALERATVPAGMRLVR
jgi:osmoprotectant transport system permease protein